MRIARQRANLASADYTKNSQLSNFQAGTLSDYNTFPGMQTIPVNDSIPKVVNDFNDSFHATLEDSIMS